MSDHTNSFKAPFILNIPFDIGVLPVLIANGKPAGEVLRFVKVLKQGGASSSTLYSYVYCIKLLYDYWLTIADLTERRSPEEFMQGLWNYIMLRKISHRTAKTYIGLLNEFFDFCQRELHYCNLNPALTQQLTQYEAQAADARIRWTQLLSHLNQDTTKITRAFEPSKHFKRFDVLGAHPAYFPIDKFPVLLNNADNVRDKLLWLLLGMGGMRLSEALHLFINDICCDESGSAVVTLSDPEYGLYPPQPSFQGPRCGRSAILAKHNLAPRNTLAKTDPLYLGWKGMMLDDKETLSARIHWLLPEAGVLFWRLHSEYMKTFRLSLPSTHPYYFVSLQTKYYGSPLKVSNAQKQFRNACSNIGVTGVNHPHSLRHFYGTFAHDVLGLPLSVVQICMRHKSMSSSAAYAKLTPSTISKLLVEGKDKMAVANQELFTNYSHALYK